MVHIFLQELVSYTSDGERESHKERIIIWFWKDSSSLAEYSFFCTLFFRDAASLFWAKKSWKHKMSSLPMAWMESSNFLILLAPTGSKECSAFDWSTKGSQDIPHTWTTAEIDRIWLYVACPQVSSDRSPVSLSTGGLQFYPLLVALVKYSEKLRIELINSRKTMTAYLPAFFEDRNTCQTQKSKNLNLDVFWK